MQFENPADPRKLRCLANIHKMNTFRVEIVEPVSGQVRTICLYDGVEQEEVRMIFEATFGLKSPPVGFVDDRKINYPFSVMAKNPKLFSGQKLVLIAKDAAPMQEADLAESPGDSEELVLTDENAEKAFNILDKNGDGYLHKEEIVEVLTVAYNKFLEFSPRFHFAYSCLAAKDVAAVTAQSLLSSVETSDGDYCLDFDDFCAWYLSAGHNPLRELMVIAMESLSSIGSIFGEMSPRSAKYSKGRVTQKLEGAYADEKIVWFVGTCQSLLRLSGSSLSYLLDLIAVSAKGRSFITHDLYTKIFYVYMLQHNHQLTEADQDIVQILDTVFDMLSTEAADKVSLLELGSLLCTVTNGKYLQSLKTLFDMYPDSHTGFVSESILANHLCQVLRVIFYFNKAIAKVTGCYPEDLSCALAAKVFLLMESNRKSKGKLSFEEFCESFLHGLMLGLNMLHIRSGFFYEYVERLMTYLGNAARGGARSSGAKRGASSDEEGDDIESYEDEGEGEDGEGEFDDSDEDEDTSDGDHDTEAATGRLASTIEDDTLDGMDLQSREEDSSAGGVQLEDSQVAASEVGYEGAAISVLEARQILGLTEYSSKVLCHFILQELADPRGEIDQELFFRGLSKLIGDRYVSASVLTRSKIDFVLSRLFSVFDPDDSGKCSAVELGCGLLLFCGEDAMVRSRVAWDLLESDSAHGSPVNYEAVVRAVSAVIKAQVCLDPAVDLDAVLSAVEVRGNLECVAYFPQQRLDRVILNSAPQFHELFTCTLFMCQSEAMDLELEKYQQHHHTVKPAARGIAEFDDSSDGEEQRGVQRGEEEEEYGQVASDPDLGSSSEEESERPGSQGKKGSSGNLSLKTFSFDRDELDEEEENVYTNDKHFPPSAVVLELRAARAILGLESYCADEMMASLAENSPGGQLSESGWLKWLNVLTLAAGTPEQDLSIAINLGNRLFEAFDVNSAEGSPVKGAPREARIQYERIAAGLAFLCGGSPLEERLMVAFTVMDSDSDGCITPVELLELIHSALITISVCSRMVADKVILLGAPLTELAEAAAIEAISALNVDDTAAYITLEMLCEMSDDFLKLTALF